MVVGLRECEKVKHTIEELYRLEKRDDVTVQGVVIDVRHGSGIVLRCKTCKRITTDCKCKVHGETETFADLRAKAVLDDGTGAMTLVIGKSAVEKLTGKTLAEIQKKAVERNDKDYAKDMFKEKLIARPLRVRGLVNVSDDFGILMVVREADFFKPKVASDQAQG